MREIQDPSNQGKGHERPESARESYCAGRVLHARFLGVDPMSLACGGFGSGAGCGVPHSTPCAPDASRSRFDTVRAKEAADAPKRP